MYIVAIGWLYVVTLMALAEANWVAGVLTWIFYGLLPVSLLLWLTGAFSRRAGRRSAPDSRRANDDRTDAVANEERSGYRKAPEP